MNSFRRSVLSLVLFLTTSCVFLARASAQDSRPLVDEKYSLEADREAFEELRKDIPAKVRKENDEKAFMDQMMSDLSKPPTEVRNKFSSIVNKKRNLFSKDMNAERESFSKKQTKDRNEFTKKQSDARADFSKKKASPDERRDFFENLETERKNFYTDQREKRDEFEENTRDKRKNFDDYIRAKTDEFNQLHRDYVKRYDENKKDLADAKKQAELKRQQQQKALDQEYEGIRKKDPTYLKYQQNEDN